MGVTIPTVAESRQLSALSPQPSPLSPQLSAIRLTASLLTASNGRCIPKRGGQWLGVKLGLAPATGRPPGFPGPLAGRLYRGLRPPNCVGGPNCRAPRLYPSPSSCLRRRRQNCYNVGAFSDSQLAAVGAWISGGSLVWLLSELSPPPPGVPASGSGNGPTRRRADQRAGFATDAPACRWPARCRTIVGGRGHDRVLQQMLNRAVRRQAGWSAT